MPNFSSFYDKYNPNPLHFKKKKNATHEFGLELEPIIPSAGEVRLLGNRHRQCQYYAIGKINLMQIYTKSSSAIDKWIDSFADVSYNYNRC